MAATAVESGIRSCASRQLTEGTVHNSPASERRATAETKGLWEAGCICLSMWPVIPRTICMCDSGEQPDSQD